MKIISKKYWQDMKNFVEQNKLCCRQGNQNVGGNLYIGRYLNGQIWVNRYIYRSVSITYIQIFRKQFSIMFVLF